MRVTTEGRPPSTAAWEAPIADKLQPSSSTPPRRALGRRRSLDGLRGSALLLVLFYHVLTPAIPAGFIAIDIFFVLSGFLITTLLLQERATTGHISLPRFYVWRVLRLLPACLVMLAAVGLFVVLEPNSPLAEPAKRGIRSTLEYISNWVAWNTDLGMLAHTWSLSLEEQFYLVWPPLLVVLFLLGGHRAAITACIAGIGAAIEVRVLLDIHGGTPWFRLYMGLDTRADALLIGCLLALVADLGLLERLPRRAVEAAGLVGLGVFSWVVMTMNDWNHLNTLGYTGIDLCSVAILTALVIRPATILDRLFGWAPLVSIGRISYGLYLWHYPLVVMLLHGVPFGPLPKPIILVLVLAGSLILALLSQALVEKPCLELRHRIPLGQRRAGHGAQGPQPTVVPVPTPHMEPAA